ncbi:PqqD family protein [Desulfocapsa sulfexigens]|uniref:PqqD family protein n=1 Tax=Desulfocapsa sulfexigens TaxID=65555 RepID=UPI00034C2B74|nr:PqqD family protein [Desulfocapsa sulfexigens]
MSKDVLRQEIDGETVLLDMKSENYFGLNDVGSHVLEMLQDGSNLDSLVSHLLSIYEIGKQQLEIDITELLQQLLDAGLISPS